jgi:hypothetical protein
VNADNIICRNDSCFYPVEITEDEMEKQIIEMEKQIIEMEKEKCNM